MTPLRTYYRGRHLTAMRDEAAATTRYFHFDHQGTTQALTDQTGAVTDRFGSDAWGTQVKRTGSTINRQWYIGNWGYYRQVDRSLDYVRARLLENRVGAWLAKDCCGASRGQFQYVSNQPISLIDPTGEDEVAACDCCCCLDKIGDYEDRWADLADLISDPEVVKQLRDVFRKQTGLRGDPVYGHYFSFKAYLRYPKAPAFSECDIEWWECSTDPRLKDVKPRVWANVTDTFKLTHGYDEWREHLKRSVRCPPDPIAIKVYDAPLVLAHPFVGPPYRFGEGRTQTRDLYIFVRLKSHEDCQVCPPANRQLTLRLWQRLVVEKGRGKTLLSGLARYDAFPGGDPEVGKPCSFKPRFP